MTQAITTFPSATSPSVPELVSGRYAEIDGLPAPGAVHAFDREQRRVIRYITNPDSWQWPIVTLFDATRQLPALTIFEGRWDGPKSVLTQFSIARQAVLEVIGAHELASGDRAPVDAFLAAVRGGEPPALSLLVLNDFDMAAHFYGPESEQAHDALVAADGFLGEILATLATTRGTSTASMLDETSIILFGDHGLVTSGRYVDLVDFFSTRHLNAVDVSTLPHLLFRERLGTLWTEWPDVILVSGGSNITQVYLKQPSGSWLQQETDGATESNSGANLASLAGSLAANEGVDQVLWTGGNGSVRVLSAHNGSARILTRLGDGGKTFAYVIPADARRDPFGYLDDPDARALVCRSEPVDTDCFRTRTEWFDRTFGSRYPGAVALIPKAFHPKRFTGDLMVTLLPGYSFMSNQHGDHGNLHRDAMLTPLVLNGPGITPRPESHRPRLVDLYPSVMALLGSAPDDPSFADLDGRVLDSIQPVRVQRPQTPPPVTAQE